MLANDGTNMTVFRTILAALLLAPTLSAAQTPAMPAAYTLAAPEGGSILRLLTRDTACPLATIDGTPRAMTERSGPRDYPLRPERSADGQLLPTDFPIRTCELAIARKVRQVGAGGQRLPVLPAVVRRIVIVGDTGCRLKAKTDAWQACNDPRAWPFAHVAQTAAAMRPDLVLHVGDYVYRESPCPPGNAGCAGSPSGHGWLAWQADFFAAARPLLAAAPWAVVRGNHEDCSRAGAGWWLLLDPHPLAMGADCADPAQDEAGNHADPYAVDLGDHARLIIADFAAIGEKPLTGTTRERYTGDAARIRHMAQAGETNFIASHYPIAAVIGSAARGFRMGTPAMDDAFGNPTGGATPRAVDLPNVTAMIAGHTHLLQYVAGKGHLHQLVVGFSGTQEAAPKAPATLADLGIDAGVPPLADLVSQLGLYGFGLLERRSGGGWRFTAYDEAGRRILRRKIS